VLVVLAHRTIVPPGRRGVNHGADVEA
jgi:hypothetical protein